MNLFLPKITVITVVLNGKNKIINTIKSILNQTYNNVEYIIIDGASTDGTIELINEYHDEIDYFITEKDKGIYDAMNKGALLASGDFINFMNSGDSFSDNTIIEEVVNSLIDSTDLIYGNSNSEYPNGKFLFVTSHSIEGIWKPFFNHQTLFIKKQLLITYPFKVKYKPASDFLLVMECHYSNMGYNFQKINKTICNTMVGGDSNRNELYVLYLYFIIMLKHDQDPKKIFYYLIKSIWIGITVAMKYILPSNAYYRLQYTFRKYVDS